MSMSFGINQIVAPTKPESKSPSQNQNHQDGTPMSTDSLPEDVEVKAAPKRGDALRAALRQRDAAWAKVEKLTSENRQLRKALSGVVPRGWRDGSMDHMRGIKAARMALGVRLNRDYTPTYIEDHEDGTD